jgi:hypothetical protein
MSFNAGAPLEMELRDVPKQQAKRKHPEQDFQCACVKHYNERCVYDRALREQTKLYAVAPLSNKLSDWQKILQKRMGLVSGVYDLHFMDQRRGWQYTWIECKSLVGKLTDEQKEWDKWLHGTPIIRCTVRTLDEFMAVIHG